MVKHNENHRLRRELKRLSLAVTRGAIGPKTCDLGELGGPYATDLRAPKRRLTDFISQPGMRSQIGMTGIRTRVSRRGQGRIRGPQKNGISQMSSVGFENKEHRS